VFGRRKQNKQSDKKVVLRFQGKDYELRQGWFFKPTFTVSFDGDLVGNLETSKDFSIEVISID